MSSGDACFNFYLQTFKDFERTPIEQSTVEWKEDTAPPVLVTKITIPAQQFDSPGQTTFCENLSYTPWHVLPEHKPLGAVNRARRVVYTAVSKLRHGLNGAFRSEAYRRARQTAELAGFCASAESDLDLMEWDYGDYEGRRTVDIRSARPGWVLFEDGCPGGETLVDMATRADRVIARVRALKNDVLVFAHRDILRILIARWIALPALEARRLDLATASVSTLGYDHGLDEPVIRRLNDA